jgi:hypothetical protein
MGSKRLWLMFTLLIALGLSACGGATGTTGTAGNQAEQEAVQDFISERGSDIPLMVGTIEQINGNTLTVKDVISNASSTVQLVADGKVRKDVPVQLAEIQAGEEITAFGNTAGGTFTARIVQIGKSTAFADGGGPVMIGIGEGAAPSGDTVGGQGNDPSASEPQTVPLEGQPPADATGGDTLEGAPGEAPVVGTVESVQGNTINVKRAEGGTIALQLDPAAEIRKQADVPITELKAGMLVQVSGAQNGATVEATLVEVLPEQG